MAQTIVQVNFKLNVSGKVYEQAVAPLAQPMADVAGLQWKIWLLNESSHEAGGIYLFEDQDSANAFLNGPLVAQVKSAPILSDLSAAQFAVMESLTEITHGPLTTPAQRS
jgi:hypothetical protein